MRTSPVTKSSKNGARLVVGGDADRRNRKVTARRAARREAGVLTRLIGRMDFDSDDVDFAPSHLLTDRDVS